MLVVNTLGSLGVLSLGKHGQARQMDPAYVKAKEFTLCLEEIAKNYDRQHSAIAASSNAGKQLAQSFAAYSKVAGFHQPVYPIAEFLSKSNLWLTTTEDLSAKLLGNLNEKAANPTKDNLKTQTLTLKAIKQKKRTITTAGQSQQVVRKEDKKTSEQCAHDIEEMTMNSLYCFWECYLDYFDECQKLMNKVKDGLANMKKLSADALKAKRLGAKKIFGVPLEELAEREAPAHLPQVVENMIACVANVASAEGIFRVSGSKTSVDSLRDQIDSGVIPDFSSMIDAHTIPTLFKAFLRMLPTPVVPYESFLSLPSLNAPNISTDVILTHLRELVNSLPSAHHYLLWRLLSLCQKIVAEKAKNKMTSSNLSVVIGPNIIRPPDLAAASTPDSFGDSNTAVQLLIDHFDALFPEKTSFTKPDADVSNNPSPKLVSARKLRAHGITIDRNTVINLNYEADIALGNSGDSMHSPTLSSSQSLPNVHTYATAEANADEGQWDAPSSPRSRGEPPLSPRGEPPLSPRTAHHTHAQGGSPHDAGVSQRPPTRPARPNQPLAGGASESKNIARPPAQTMTNGSTQKKNSPVPVKPSPASSSPPTKPPPLSPSPSLSSAPPTYPPPSPSSSNSTSPPFITSHNTSSPSSHSTSSPSISSSSHNTSASSNVSNGKKIIGQSTFKKPLSPGPPPRHAPPSAPSSHAHATHTSHALATSHSAPNLTVAHGSAAHARAPAHGGGGSKVSLVMDAPIEVVKGEISKVLAVVIEQQLGLVRGKLVDVKSIPDGVPFIHVLKAITPELDKLKKIMPTPPTFEKLPDLPLDYNKFARLKFTLDFALKDLTRVLEQVATYAAAHGNHNDTSVLQQILLSVTELQRVLSCNIVKL